MMDDFLLDVSPHKYLATGLHELQAVLTVTAGGASAGAAPPEAAEVIVVDCSGSMMLETKMADARRATAAAIDALRDGTRFAVVAGNSEATMVFPVNPELAVAGAATRVRARKAVHRLRPVGGTSIGVWLTLARDLLRDDPAAVRHVTLLTDGCNTEAAGRLDEALARCRDTFQCDARGLGRDWNAKELIRIAVQLRGSARAVTARTDLAGEFRAIVAGTMAKSVGDVRLRVQLSPFASLRFLRQVHPVKADLGAHARETGTRTVEVATGAWAPGEDREYHVGLDVGDAGELDEDLRAGRIDVVTGDDRRGSPALLLLHRTDDPYRSLPGDEVLDGVSAQEDLSRAVGDGCSAYEAGDLDRALAAWGRAAALAHRTGDRDMLGLLAQVVHLDDAAAGRVRARAGVRPEDLLRLETESVWSQRSRSYGRSATATAAHGPDKVCACGWISPAGARFCTECARPL